MIPKTGFRKTLERLTGRGPGAVLARGAGSLMVLQVMGLAVQLLAHVVLARTLGVTEYGVFVYVFSWLAVLLIPCRLGMATAALRFVASYFGEERWGPLRGFLRFALLVVGSCSLVVMAATALSVELLGDRLTPSLRWAFLVGCLGLPLGAWLHVSGAILRGLKKVVAAQAPSMVGQPALLALGVVTLFVWGSAEPTAPVAMSAWVASWVVALLWSTLILLRTIPAPVRSVEPVVHGAEWTRVAMPLLAINLLNVALQRADVVLLGSLLGPDEAGLYAPARRLATLIALGLSAVNAWVAPAIADLHTRGEREKLQRLVRRSAQLIFAITAPLAIGLLIGGRPLLGLFGPEFVAAYPALAILLIGQVVNAAMGPVGFLMTMTGHQAAAARILGVNSVLAIALMAVLIPRFGVQGAAWGSAIGMVTWNVAMAISVWRRLRLRATLF